MASVAQWIRTLTEWTIVPFDYPGGLLGLTVFSALSGVAMLWVMGKTTNQSGMERARERMLASVYEIRLFLDSPRRVLSAQGKLFIWNGKYVAYMLPAFIILGPMLVLMYMHLDIRFGWHPLTVGEAVMVAVDMEEGADGTTLEIAEAQCEGVRVTAPPLYSSDENRVYLRVELEKAAGNILALKVGDKVVTKEMWGASEKGFVSPERSGGLAHLWAIGMEPPIAVSSGVRSIVVEHMPKDMDIFGVPMPWWVYWLIISLVAALAMRRPMGVVL